MAGQGTFGEATRAHEGGDLDGAIFAYRGLLQDDSAQPDVLANLGIALCQRGDTEDGLQKLRWAVSLSDDPAIRYNLGYALLEAGRCQEARTILCRLAEIVPGDPDIQDALTKAVRGSQAADEERRLEEERRVDAQEPFSLPKSMGSQKSTGSPEPFGSPQSAGAAPADCGDNAQNSGAAAAHKPGTLQDQFAVLERVYRAHGTDEDLRLLETRRESLQDASLRVFMIGKGKFGKSNLINHLLGVEMADVGRKPTTWRVDFYRTSPDGTEYAELRRHNREGVERLSLTDAETLCAKEGEAALRPGAGPEAGTGAGPEASADGLPTLLAADGQIIQVDWYRAASALDARITLVDTPGFAQPRRAAVQEDVTQRAQGFVVRIEDAFEFDKADLVLWALKATKLEDAETLTNLQRLTERKIPVLGVLTHWDEIAGADRADRLREAWQRFRPYVTDLVCVGCPGRDTPEVAKEGIPELRAWLTARAEEASCVKTESARAFCAGEAGDAAAWLQALGDGLIQNVAEFSLYCHEASDLLLRGVGAVRETLIQEVDRRLSPGAQSRVLPILQSGAANAQKQERLADVLRISDLSRLLTEHLCLETRALVAERSPFARRRKLIQVIRKSRGKSQTRPLQARIVPPPMEASGLGLTTLAVPAVSTGFMDLLFEAFRGSWLGDVAEAFGGRSGEERREEAAQQAFTAIRGALEGQIDRILGDFVKAGADAILASADSGVRDVYSGHTLRSLRAYAASLDAHIALLPAIDARLSGVAQYERDFTLWSPVDDGRQVILSLFGAWFAQHQSIIRARIALWGGEALIACPPSASFVYACVRSRVAETEQRFHISGPIPLASLASARTPRLNLIRLFAADAWLGDIARQVTAKEPFGSKKGFLQEAFPDLAAEAFEHFHLEGLSAAFSAELGGVFRATYAERFAAQPPLDVTADIQRIRFQPAHRMGTWSVLGAAAGAALISGLSFLPRITVLVFAVLGALWQRGSVLGPLEDLYAAEFHSLAATVFALVRAAVAVLMVQYLIFLEDKNRYIVSLVTRRALQLLHDIGTAAWKEVAEKITPDYARALAAEYTLVGLRPLDYARDGLFRKYADERPNPVSERPGIVDAKPAGAVPSAEDLTGDGQQARQES